MDSIVMWVLFGFGIAVFVLAIWQWYFGESFIDDTEQREEK